MSKKSKDPAVLWYTSDFLTGTMFMTNEQVGIYARLLCVQHQHGGIIDKVSFNTMVKSDDVLIKSKFIEVEEGFYNERMLMEMDKRQVNSEKQRERIQNYWDEQKGIPRKVVGNSTELPIEELPIENENENENRIKNENIIKKRKDEFANLVFECDPLKYSKTMLENFVSYWTETNRSRTKMRFEMEKVFEIKRRLATWERNDKEYNKIQHDDLILYNELLRRFNAGETDIWDKFEKVIVNGKNMWKRKNST